MKAVDTNVVLRWLIEDDPAQSAIARDIFERPVALSLTVLLEAAWVLRSRYRFSDAETAELLSYMLEVDTVFVPHAELVTWALKKFSTGADIADMIHLASASRHDMFATFDRSIARAAGADAPLPIETLA